MLDLDSYGHFQDPETQHTTWYCNPACATIGELIRFYIIVTIDKSYQSKPDEPEIKSKLLGSLVDGNIRCIMSVEDI